MEVIRENAGRKRAAETRVEFRCNVRLFTCQEQVRRTFDSNLLKSHTYTLLKLLSHRQCTHFGKRSARFTFFSQTYKIQSIYAHFQISEQVFFTVFALSVNCCTIVFLYVVLLLFVCCKCDVLLILLKIRVSTLVRFPSLVINHLLHKFVAFTNCLGNISSSQ